MNEVQVIVLQYSLLTFLGTVIFLGLVAGFFIFLRRKKMLKNPIDVVILELTQNGYRFRKEIGRKDHFEGAVRIVTAGPGSGKRIKDNLGYGINDDDLGISTIGRNRTFLLVAMKDGLSAPLRAVLEGDLEDDDGEPIFDDKSKELLSKVYKIYNKPVAMRLDEIPSQLSLKPILSEQTRFAIDYSKEKAVMTGEDPAKFQRRMMLMSAGLFALTIIICFVLFIVFMNQGPQVAASVAAKSMSAVNNIPIPGI